MSQITATHINYLHVCRRKLWLFDNGVQMEHTSDLVAEGKLIGKEAYPQRPEKYKEVQLGNVKIDFYDAKNGVVHEIKKSAAREEAHVAQVRFYLYTLRRFGLPASLGILEYPKLRLREEVRPEPGDDELVGRWLAEIGALRSGKCPPKLKKTQCKNCSYFDFCWVGELEDES